jgi:hypothetical protein
MHIYVPDFGSMPPQRYNRRSRSKLAASFVRFLFLMCIMKSALLAALSLRMRFMHDQPFD